MAGKDTDKRERELQLQKTCFIITVNLKHICKKTDWDNTPEDEIIEELEMHWDEMCQLPNLKLARGQIERNKNGRLHINAGLKFHRVWRARTLQNKGRCYAEPARNEEAVMNYGKKQATRVKELPNFGVKKAKVKNLANPKQEALAMLMDGMTPKQICMAAPDVYFTHHRAINETYKMMILMPVGFEFGGEEE